MTTQTSTITATQRIRTEVDNKLLNLLIEKILDRATALHKKKGFKLYDCECSYCTVKAQATKQLSMMHWRKRGKERNLFRSSLAKLDTINSE